MRLGTVYMAPGATLAGLGQQPVLTTAGASAAPRRSPQVVPVPVLHLTGAAVGALVGARAFRGNIAVGLMTGIGLGLLAAQGVRSWAAEAGVGATTI